MLNIQVINLQDIQQYKSLWTGGSCSWGIIAKVSKYD